jgi:hypothetical protein
MIETEDVRYLRALRRVLLWALAAAAVALGAIVALLFATGHASAQPVTIPAIGSIQGQSPAIVPDSVVAIVPEKLVISPARTFVPRPRVAQSIVGRADATVSTVSTSADSPAVAALRTVETTFDTAMRSIAPGIDVRHLFGIPGISVPQPRQTPMTPFRQAAPELRLAPLMSWGPNMLVAPARPGAGPQLHAPTLLFAYPPVATPHKSHGQLAVEAAESKLGSSYRYGSAGPDRFDCSGLVQWSYRQAGVDVPRTSWAQLHSGTPVGVGDLQPGDLVSFYGGEHSALYVGDGKVIHASEDGIGVVETPMKYMPVAGCRRF